MTFNIVKGNSSELLLYLVEIIRIVVPTLFFSLNKERNLLHFVKL